MKRYGAVSIRSTMNSPDEIDPATLRNYLFSELAVLPSLAACLFGVFAATLLVMASTLSARLRLPIHSLMGFAAMIDFVVCVYLVQVRIMVLNGWHKVPQRACFFGSLHGLAALNAQTGVMLAMVAERVFAAYHRKERRTNKRKTSQSFRKWPFWFFIFIFSTLLTTIGWAIPSGTEVLISCFSGSSYGDSKTRLIWLISHLVGNFVCVLLLALTYRKIRSTETGLISLSVLRSLAIISIFSFICWIVFSLGSVGQMFANFPSSIELHLSWPLLLVSTIRPITLFTFERKYRRAMLLFLTCGWRGELDGRLPMRQSAAATGFLALAAATARAGSTTMDF